MPSIGNGAKYDEEKDRRLNLVLQFSIKTWFGLGSEESESLWRWSIL